MNFWCVRMRACSHASVLVCVKEKKTEREREFVASMGFFSVTLASLYFV